MLIYIFNLIQFGLLTKKIQIELGEKSMAIAKEGDTVQIYYTGKLEDGTIFDSNIEGPPLNFTIGDNQVIKGFEEAVLGMTEGKSKHMVIPPEKGYGPRLETFMMVIKRSDLPPNIEPKIGMMLHGQSQNGDSIDGTVVKIKEETLTLDANHPLAGKKLSFEIKLEKIA